ncbi:WD40-repeat-containing domain protein [Cokeromyces recurvatus]|uniref:WD40-repeat-containing domain protein n=1 Tax=Cokeromyces recurvatus TaxID=90255 RepID=UPI0022210264|nr:WD40-repeat-containing domain protein [Cokeromyces recurvatus]KAI7899951.1 WD40-repeat-containing domain protein [Cokeromyces recurvatus]
MAPVNKKAKTDASEKELEDLLFGSNADDMWNKTGHELDINNKQTKDESGEDDDDEDENEEAFFFDSGPVTFTFDVPTVGEQATNDEIDYEAEEENDDKQTSLDEISEDEDSDDDRSEDEYAAWEDEDDKNLKISLMSSNITKKLRNDVDEDVINGAEYTRRLRKQFNKIYPKPNWARLPSEIKAEERKRKAADSDDDDDNDDDANKDEDELDNETRLDLLKSTMGILERRSTNRTISAKKLDIQRLKNANRTAPRTKIPITSVAFHPNAQVLMTAGLDKTLRLFQIDGKINPKIQSVRFKDMPIFHAEFHPSGDQIVVSGRRRFFYIYDIQTGVIDRCPGIWGKEEKSLEKFSISPCGRYIAFLGTSGTIIIVSYVTKKWFCDLKMTGGSVQSVDWSSDGNFIFGFSNVGEVFQFDIQKKECVKRWHDDGCIGGTVISVSPNEKYYAAGSSSGIVNLYDRSVLDPNITNPKPIKAIQNLTTKISNITFSHDSQLMVISSQSKRDQLRIIHVPTATAYSNWPTDRTPLNDVTSVAFSPNSDYLAIANRAGHVLLYTLKHYALK